MVGRFPLPWMQLHFMSFNSIFVCLCGLAGSNAIGPRMLVLLFLLHVLGFNIISYPPTPALAKAGAPGATAVCQAFAYHPRQLP